MLRAAWQVVVLVLSILMADAFHVAGAEQPSPAWLPGINLADGAFNEAGTRRNFDYTYPTTQQMDHFLAKGFRVFRVPVIAKRILPNGSAVNADWSVVTALVTHAAAKGAYVLIDLHQFGGMASGLVGRDVQATADFVQFWRTVAERLKGSHNVIFGLMNEPHLQSASQWLGAANAAISAIRGVGANQLILVPGSYWDGAYTWTRTDNSSVMTGVADPRNNIVYELHQYLDVDSSGTSKDVVPGSGAERLRAFTEWARPRHARGFLGEFGFAATPEALKEGADLLAFMKANADVWCGWTYWAAGAWWGDYMFSVEPGPNGDKPQMAVLERYK